MKVSQVIYAMPLSALFLIPMAIAGFLLDTIAIVAIGAAIVLLKWLMNIKEAT